MTSVESVQDVTGARIVMADGELRTVTAQLRAGIIPTAELCDKLDAISGALLATVNRDTVNATAARLTADAFAAVQK